MFAYIGQKNYAAIDPVPTIGQGLYVPLDPRYQAWPGTEVAAEEQVDAWRQTHLDAITEDVLRERPSTWPEDIFASRRTFLRKSIEETLGHVYERERIKYDHLERIDYESCSVSSKLMEIEDWHPGLNPNVDKVRSNAERELANFEREKRMEETACWGDITRLQSDLRELMREWTQEQQRSYLINGNP